MNALSAPCVNGGIVSSPPNLCDAEPAIPAYLIEHYWWAYIHPRAVQFFERNWVVNVILWGNYARLCRATLAELGGARSGQVLQVACAYGDFTQRLSDLVPTGGGTLDVVDILPMQLTNLERKLPAAAPVRLLRMNSGDLKLQTASYDVAILFFLLHEQPDDVRTATLNEAFRIVRPGGKIVIVDYAAPAWWNPVRLILVLVLATLEPFALGVWRRDLRSWMPLAWRNHPMRRCTYFGGTYQKVVADV